MPKFEMIELSKKGFSIFNVVNGDINRQWNPQWLIYHAFLSSIFIVLYTKNKI
jgi:hypothetical protein